MFGEWYIYCVRVAWLLRFPIAEAMGCMGCGVGEWGFVRVMRVTYIEYVYCVVRRSNS